MNSPRTYIKFNPQQKEIEALERKSDRFRRINSEYELMKEELWNLQNNDVANIPDDFLNAFIQQTEYLEHQVGDWLLAETKIQE